MVRRLLSGGRPILRLLLLITAVYLLMSALVPVRPLLDVVNGVLFAASLGVATAYAPIAVPAIFTDEPSTGQWLTVGIWFGWMSSAALRVVAIGVYGFNETQWSVSHGTAAIVTASIFATMCHFVAPEAVRGAVPRRSWIHLGLLVSAGALVGLLVLASGTGPPL